MCKIIVMLMLIFATGYTDHYADDYYVAPVSADSIDLNTNNFSKALFMFNMVFTQEQDYDLMTFNDKAAIEVGGGLEIKFNSNTEVRSYDLGNNQYRLESNEPVTLMLGNALGAYFTEMTVEYDEGFAKVVESDLKDKYMVGLSYLMQCKDWDIRP